MTDIPDVLELALKFRDESASPEKAAAIAAKRAAIEAGALECRALLEPLGGQRATLGGRRGVFHVRMEPKAAFLDFCPDVSFEVQTKLPDGRVVPVTRYKAGTTMENVIVLRKDAEQGFVANNKRCATLAQAKQLVAAAIGPHLEP
jgi:hypothetical protein